MFSRTKKPSTLPHKHGDSNLLGLQILSSGFPLTSKPTLQVHGDLKYYLPSTLSQRFERCLDMCHGFS